MFSMTGEYMYLSEDELKVRFDALIDKKGMSVEDTRDLMIDQYPRQEGDILMLVKQRTGESIEPSMVSMIESQLGMIANMHREIREAISSGVNPQKVREMMQKARGMISVVDREADML